MIISNIDIDERYKEISALPEHKSSRETILNLIDWITHISPDIRQLEIKKLARLLLIELRDFQDWSKTQTDKDFCEQLSRCIDMIAVTEYADDIGNSDTECIRFLNRLNKNPVQDDVTEVVRKYWQFQDLLPQIKGLFLLEREDGTKLYPIYEMVIGMARNFRCDNDHLINLVIALQMFEKAEQYAKIDERSTIQQEISKIAQDNNIAFLELLNNGGSLIFHELDYEKNGTLIVEKNNQVIIRNTRQDYFCGYFLPEDIIPEKNHLAWFVQITLESDEELTDLHRIFSEDTQEIKQEFLKLVEQQGIFNLFLPRRIVWGKNNHKIIRFLNSASVNDRAIVGRDQEEENNKEGFLRLLRSDKENLRSCWLFRTGYDILTVDYYAAFYLNVVKNRWEFCTDLETGKNQFYQGWLIEKYLREVLSDDVHNYDETQLLCDLTDFLIQYFDFPNIDQNTLMDGKLLAFPWIGNFNSCLSDYFQPESISRRLFGDSANKWECLTAVYQKRERTWKIKETAVRESDFLTSDLSPLTETGEHLPKTDLTVFVNHEEAKIVYSSIVTDTEKRLEKIRDLFSWQVIQYDNRDQYLNNKLKRLLHLMEANNLNPDVYRLFQYDPYNKEILCLYKVLWHFQIFMINEKKIDIFWQLYLEKHYLGTVENTDAIKNYFKQMLQYAEEDGTLVLAKESSGNDSTLYYLFQKFGRDEGGRSYLSWAFDEGQINSHLTKNNKDEIFWRKKKLKKIIFMDDNLMYGDNLKKMLEFQINQSENKNPKRAYLRINPSIQQILNKHPEITVEVHVMFGFEGGVSQLETDYPVHIMIHEIIPDAFYSDQETVRLVNDIYADKAQQGICCIFRYNNLPAKSVLPEYVRDVWKRAGLFQRQREL